MSVLAAELLLPNCSCPDRRPTITHKPTQQTNSSGLTEALRHTNQAWLSRRPIVSRLDWLMAKLVAACARLYFGLVFTMPQWDKHGIVWIETETPSRCKCSLAAAAVPCLPLYSQPFQLTQQDTSSESSWPAIWLQSEHQLAKCKREHCNCDLISHVQLLLLQL